MTTLSILYDNHATESLRPGWGFSAYIRTEGAIVLFDTGADKLVLQHNAQALQCNLDIVTALVLSHEHCDHVGAVSVVLHKGLHMYVPAAFAKRFSDRAGDGIDFTAVKKPVEIVPGVRSIGQFGRKTPEQAILVDGNEGPVLITGCAHEGIVKIARQATELAERPLSLLLGGFHLYKEDEADIGRTADALLKLNIQRIAPCHCTGDTATGVLRETFGGQFVEIQAGSQIEL